MSEQINVHQAKTHLSRLLERAEAGEEIVIARAGRPVAKLVPYCRLGAPAGSAVEGEDLDRSQLRWHPRRSDLSVRGAGVRPLLDTHVVLWALGDVAQLAPGSRAAIAEPDNDVYVSAAGLWEIATKELLGTLRLPAPAREWMPTSSRVTVH